jgi:hypothetical protein
MLCLLLLMMLPALGAQAEPREDILGLMNQVDRDRMYRNIHFWLQNIGDADPEDGIYTGTRCAATEWADTTALALRDSLIGYGWDVGLEPVSFLHEDPDIGQVDSWNVIARKDGWHADGMVVMGAHYDTVDEKVEDAWNPGETNTTSYDDIYSPAPGADDNGSGTVALLEMARILGHCSFRQDIELCFFTAEEIGIKGSEQHVAALDAADINVAGYFNVDMIGWDDFGEPDFRLFYDPQSIWFKNIIVGYLNDYALYPFDQMQVGDSWSNSDLLHFWQNSKPAVGFWEGGTDAEDHSPYWNQSLDNTSEFTISGTGDFLAGMTKTILAVFCEWADVRVTTDAPGSPPGSGLLAAWPNPFRPGQGAASLRYGRGAAGLDAEINIFDVNGRLQRVLRTNAEGMTRWDGRNARGEELPAGVYLARVAGEAEMEAERIVLLR